jgi:hypothetical protein
VLCKNVNHKSTVGCPTSHWAPLVLKRLATYIWDEYTTTSTSFQVFRGINGSYTYTDGCIGLHSMQLELPLISSPNLPFYR